MRLVKWPTLGCSVAALLSCGETLAPDAGPLFKSTSTHTFLSTSLGTVHGAATAINEAGEVVGTNDNDDHAFVWSKGTLADLAALPGIQGTMATGINNRGQVVGISPTSGGAPVFPHAVIWDRGKVTDLGTLPDAVYSYSAAQDLNARGQVVGWSSSPIDFGNDHAVVWENGKIRDLGAPPRGASYAFGINDLGNIVGWTQAYDANSRAALWAKVARIDLGVLPDADYSYANKINNRGQIVGGSGGSNWEHAVLWEDGEITDLGTLPGGARAGASDINASGWVAGWSDATDGEVHAVLWKDGAIHDFGLGQAFGINNRGQIVGSSRQGPTLWSLE
jgi:probable HAF family extracellular repeat protein